MKGGKHVLKIVALGCICLILFSSCEREEENESTDSLPAQKIVTFSMQHTVAGVKRWHLRGESSEIRSDKVIVKNPKVQIFEEGKISITLTGDKGEFFPTGKQKDNLYFYGGVVGVNESGTLFTEELHWLNKEGNLYSPTEAKLVRGDSTWYGIEMVANPDLETIKMSNNRFKLYPKDEETNE